MKKKLKNKSGIRNMDRVKDKNLQNTKMESTRNWSWADIVIAEDKIKAKSKKIEDPVPDSPKIVQDRNDAVVILKTCWRNGDSRYRVVVVDDVNLISDTPEWDGWSYIRSIIESQDGDMRYTYDLDKARNIAWQIWQNSGSEKIVEYNAYYNIIY